MTFIMLRVRLFIYKINNYVYFMNIFQSNSDISHKSTSYFSKQTN